MTDQDQNAAIGELVTRHAETKRRHIALAAKLESFHELFSALGRALSGIAYSVHIPTVSPDYPDRAALAQLLDELRTTTADLERYKRQLKGLGID